MRLRIRFMVLGISGKVGSSNCSDRLRIKLSWFTRRNNRSRIKIRSFRGKGLKLRIWKGLRKIKYSSFRKRFRMKGLIST